MPSISTVIRKPQVIRLLGVGLVLSGIGNAAMRQEISNPLTAFRILAPTLALIASCVSPRAGAKFILGVAVFVGYNFCLTSFSSLGFDEFWAYLIHWIYIGLLILVMTSWRRLDRSFDDFFFEFVGLLAYVLIASIFLEYLLGNWYPNQDPSARSRGALTGMYWNENDLALALCVMSWWIFSRDDWLTGLAPLLAIGCILLVLWFNDSKAALLSICLVSMPIAIWLNISRNLSSGASRGTTLAAIITVVTVLCLAFSDHEFDFGRESVSLHALLITPLKNILADNPTGETFGSLSNRTDAAIFCLREFLSRYGLGLGAGGSIRVLALPEYSLGGAQSPHNAVLQVLVDFGYPFLALLAWSLAWAVRKLVSARTDRLDRLRVLVILSLPMAGLSQSAGFMTNYFLFVTLIFAAMPRDHLARVRGLAGPERFSR